MHNRKKFTNDFVASIKNKTQEAYKNIIEGITLVDDVQFIAGKEQHKEEFSILLMNLEIKGSKYF
ncbi:MAG: DnaA/Hda family protein [Candidatus Doudnabacteria bacterium]